jgi:hypothetical protein
MNRDLSAFAARLRQSIASGFDPRSFDSLAGELFALQYAHNAAYRKICDRQGITPALVTPWNRLPFAPTNAFKVMELSSLPTAERSAVFHSSGTTGQTPGSHFHSAESMMVYEASLWTWFQANLGQVGDLLVLTPRPKAAPRSSLVHMFETIREKSALPESIFTGEIAGDGTWQLNFAASMERLAAATRSGKPLTLLGTAFSFVHLLDHLRANNLNFELPGGSRAMETGGYKNRSRELPKAELHALITEQLGISRDKIICEYGMSELSSQAYALAGTAGQAANYFHCPPWARGQITSPETGGEVAEGETGLIRVFDLANVFSVAAIQTEDLGIRRNDGFELVGRAQMAEPRGCSLMTA